MFLVLSYASVKAAVAERRPLPAGTLVVVEQMPGVVVVTDASPHLQPGGAGYYASYNRIQTPWLFELTNQSALVREFGDHFSYDKYSRAEIMSARQAAVSSSDAFRALLRYNDFAHDATGGQGCTAPARSASNAISERGDLSPVDGCPCPGVARLDEVGIDAKVTNLYLMTSGPTISIVQVRARAFACGARARAALASCTPILTPLLALTLADRTGRQRTVSRPLCGRRRRSRTCRTRASPTSGTSCGPSSRQTTRRTVP